MVSAKTIFGMQLSKSKPKDHKDLHCRHWCPPLQCRDLSRSPWAIGPPGQPLPVPRKKNIQKQSWTVHSSGVPSYLFHSFSGWTANELASFNQFHRVFSCWNRSCFRTIQDSAVSVSSSTGSNGSGSSEAKSGSCWRGSGEAKCGSTCDPWWVHGDSMTSRIIAGPSNLMVLSLYKLKPLKN